MTPLHIVLAFTGGMIGSIVADKIVAKKRLTRENGEGINAPDEAKTVPTDDRETGDPANSAGSDNSDSVGADPQQNDHSEN